MQPPSVVLDGAGLTLAQACAIARCGGARVTVSAEARRRVATARALVERIVAEDRVVYGISTGFGKLANQRIDHDHLRELQLNLIVSHAVGVGAEAPADVVRMMMLLRLNALLHGNSGVREETADLLLGMLQKDVLPVIPEQGSVGASGDLAPLAHLALVLIGQGEARVGGEKLPAAVALQRVGLKPIVLEAKEGLALINGTPFTASVGALALARARELSVVADLACALTLEGLQGSVKPFDGRIAALRPHPGHAATSEIVRRLMADSEINDAHANCSRVQDQYSVRCVPQVHGAVRDALTHVRTVFERELCSVTDNPLLFPAEGDVLSGGNFHAEPLAIPLDYATIAASELASISERRIETLVNPDLSGLPAFLAGGKPGLNSGLMILQVTAAALVSENKSLAHPASVDSIPTSANKEDHVSMGPIAARHLRGVCENVAWVLAVELVAARFALHFVGMRAGRGVQAAYETLCRVIPPPGDDRLFRKDMDAARSLIDSGELVAAAEAVVGALPRP